MNTIEINTKLSFKQLLDIVKKLSPIQKQKLHDSLWEETMSIDEEKQIIQKRKTNSKANLEKGLVLDNIDELNVIRAYDKATKRKQSFIPLDQALTEIESIRNKRN